MNTTVKLGLNNINSLFFANLLYNFEPVSSKFSMEQGLYLTLLVSIFNVKIPSSHFSTQDKIPITPSPNIFLKSISFYSTVSQCQKQLT